jgi:hypothetical protein
MDNIRKHFEKKYIQEYLCVTCLYLIHLFFEEGYVMQTLTHKERYHEFKSRNLRTKESIIPFLGVAPYTYYAVIKIKK